MKFLKFYLLAFIAIGVLLNTGCEEDDPTPLSVLTITASGTDLQSGTQTVKDLNGSAAATDVPLDAVITITFDTDIDASTATSANAKISSASGDVAATVAGSGKGITITPSADLARGTDYTLTLSAGLSSSDGGGFTSTTRSFKTAGRSDVAPPKEADQLAYWSLNGNSNSSNNNYNGTEIAVTYGADRFGNQESAAFFDGDASIIEIPNGDQLLAGGSFTLSYWVRVDSVDHVGGHFVMGVGDVYGFFIEIQGGLGGMKITQRYENSTGTIANDFFVNGDGKDANNGGWIGVEFEKDLTATGGLGAIIDQKWAHMVWVYDAGTNKRHLYINGQLIETDNLNNPPNPALNSITGVTFDDSDAGTDIIGKALAFGFNHDIPTTHWDNEPWGGYDFPDANHFKGGLDDVRIFSNAYSATDVDQLYNAEKP